MMLDEPVSAVVRDLTDPNEPISNVRPFVP
jgi:hypothetical protein